MCHARQFLHPMAVHQVEDPLEPGVDLAGPGPLEDPGSLCSDVMKLVI
jgi:hypothetical protein